jgi:hypothetical protein
VKELEKIEQFASEIDAEIIAIQSAKRAFDALYGESMKRLAAASGKLDAYTSVLNTISANTEPPKKVKG